MSRRDPYNVLGVGPDASSEELHDAYRRLVKLHHPDRNGGSAESTRRFQEVQQAYDELRRRRPAPQSPPASEESIEARMADLERELRDAVRRSRPGPRPRRPSDEELGRVTTDDSFGKILADVRDELSDRLSDAREHPSVRRVADLIDGIDGLASRFDKR